MVNDRTVYKIINHGEINFKMKKKEAIKSLVLEGKSNKEICKSVGLSESCVKYHITTILDEYGVRNRVQLMLKILGKVD